MTAGALSLILFAAAARGGAASSVEKKGPDKLISLLNQTLLNTTDSRGCTLRTRIAVSGVSAVNASACNAT